MRALSGWPRSASPRIPLRYYVWLPLGRVADMWLRPRVENLPIDLDWWVYAHHHAETEFSWAYAGLNALYLLLGIAGLCLRPRFWVALLAYMLLRSALLLTVEAPETRYTLECFPMLFALAVGLRWRGCVAQRLLLAGVEAEGALGRRLIDLDVGVVADPGLPLAFVEDLLEAHGARSCPSKQ